MSQNNMELLKWGDGTIRLSFWDAISGADVVFVLQPSGQAWRAGETEEHGESWTPIDLVRELCSLALSWEEGAED